MADEKKDSRQLRRSFEDIFVLNGDDVCKSTGLLLSTSLNYALTKHLMLQDTAWVLAVMDIDNLKVINEQIGYADANLKIDNIGRVIASFCDEDPTRTQGFRVDEQGKGDRFAVLIKYTRSMEKTFFLNFYFLFLFFIFIFCVVTCGDWSAMLVVFTHRRRHWKNQRVKQVVEVLVILVLKICLIW